MKYRMQGLPPRTREEIEALGWIVDKELPDGTLCVHREPANGIGHVGGYYQPCK